MAKEKVLTWVDPSFHKKLKVESSQIGMSILEYTKRLAREENKEQPEKKKIGGFKFDF